MIFRYSASGLGRAVVEDLHSNGGSIAILDMNEDLGNSVISNLGTHRIKFFTTDVTDTNNIKKSVDGAIGWIKETGVVLGGVICCAGVGYPSLVKLTHRFFVRLFVEQTCIFTHNSLYLDD